MRVDDFWSARRARVAEEEKSLADMELAEAQSRLNETQEAKSDQEILSEHDLPDPDTLTAEDDLSGFMVKSIPERLRLRALRRFWRLNPVLANVDGLVDYGEDFTDAATVVEQLVSTYQVGKGMSAHVEYLAEIAEKKAAEAEHGDQISAEAKAIVNDSFSDEAAVASDACENSIEDEKNVDFETIHVVEDGYCAEPASKPRRMRFQFAKSTDARAAGEAVRQDGETMDGSEKREVA